MSWLVWLIGVAIAVIVGLSIFGYYDAPVVIAQIKSSLGAEPMAKALFVALGLVAISKFF
jgi:hypothetical protein